jgi:hypothetical protein
MFAEGWRPRPRLYAVTAVLLLVHAAGVQARSNSKVSTAVILSVLSKFNTYTDLVHCLTLTNRAIVRTEKGRLDASLNHAHSSYQKRP